MEKDPYRILQVIPTAEQEVIDAAYRGLARLYHPDINPSPEASEKMKEINWAYDILKDPETRRQYDQRLSIGQQLKSSDPNQTRRESSNTAPADRHEPSQPSQTQNGRSRTSPGISFCQNCYELGPTRHISFNQNIGLIIIRHHKHIEGDFCAKCSEQFFWQYTITTLFLGWWGVYSFILTPFILLGNVYQYVKTSSIRKNVNLGSVASGWKLAFFITIFVGGLIGLIYSIDKASLNTTTSPVIFSENPSPTSPQKTIDIAATLDVGRSKMATRWAVTPESTAPRCLTWAEIGLDDVGRDACVYGNVLTAYTRNDIFYMTFSNDASDFYMVSYGGWFKGVKGNCVLGKGVIKQIGQSPILVVDDTNLYHCK